MIDEKQFELLDIAALEATVERLEVEWKYGLCGRCQKPIWVQSLPGEGHRCRCMGHNCPTTPWRATWDEAEADVGILKALPKADLGPWLTALHAQQKEGESND